MNVIERKMKLGIKGVIKVLSVTLSMFYAYLPNSISNPITESPKTKGEGEKTPFRYAKRLNIQCPIPG